MQNPRFHCPYKSSKETLFGSTRITSIFNNQMPRWRGHCATREGIETPRISYLWLGLLLTVFSVLAFNVNAMPGKEEQASAQSLPYYMRAYSIGPAGFQGTSPEHAMIGTMGEAVAQSGCASANFGVNSGFGAPLQWQILTDVAVPITLYDELYQNYPNPFNPITTIKYTVGKAARVTITIFNVKGELVKTVTNTQHLPGTYRKTWNGVDAGGKPSASGVYFCRLQIGDFSSVKKMLMLK
jgi:hypothetical protein